MRTDTTMLLDLYPRSFTLIRGFDKSLHAEEHQSDCNRKHCLEIYIYIRGHT